MIKTPPVRLLAHIGFWLAMLALAFMGWALYAANTNENESSRWVSHTQELPAEATVESGG